MTTILDTILASKRAEVRLAQQATPPSALLRQIIDLPTPLNFADALRHAIEEQGYAVIAEIKRASPSQGIIREPFDPVEIAQDYAQHGAIALSVLTDEPFFQGRLSYLKSVREAVSLPLLRKDFMIDEYQLLESRVARADAVLLIVAALSDFQLRSLWQGAMDLALSVIIEVHNTEELDRALSLPLNASTIIGVNNRNLKTFDVSLDTIIQLKTRIPPLQIGVCESGIRHTADVARLREQGVQAFLIGETFMRAPSPGLALHQLFNH